MAHGNEMADINDYLHYSTEETSLYGFNYSHHLRHTNSTSGEGLYGNQPTVTSADVTFTTLLNGDNSSIESLHSEAGASDNTSISNYLTDSSEESTIFQSQAYSLPTTSAEYPYPTTYDTSIPRTPGPFDDNFTSASCFLQYPPTISLSLQVSSYPEKPGYRSKSSTSPATSIDTFNNHGSCTTQSSIESAISSIASAPNSVRGSPFIGHEDHWSGALPEEDESLGLSEGWSDGSGFVDPRILDPSPRESPFEDPISRSNSPFNPPSSSSSSSPSSPGPSSPTIRRKRTPVSRRASPDSNRTFPYPSTRRDSIGSARSSKSPRLEHFDEPAGKMRSPSSPSTQTGTGRDSLCHECGKSFRDLRAHQLTHQEERPEKCPIATCEYSKKGFARKYDCQRHTLTHYKGTMVCGFCPGSGSAAEKSFNRADVFKRHLMTVHHVEQSPPNGRKKATGSGSSSSTHPTLSPSKSSEKLEFGVSGKCSTCSVTFATAQQFYEHLDDCVLNKVVQEEPNAAYNELNLDQVKQEEVTESLARTSLKGRRSRQANEDQEEDEDVDDEELADVDEGEDKSNDKDETWPVGKKKESRVSSLGRTPSMRCKTSTTPKVKRGPASSRYKNVSIQKSRVRKGKKGRKNVPAGYGCKPEHMVTKRRCLMVFDGPTLLCRDEMMMHTDWEVKTTTAGDSYVSDLDFWTLQRANAAIDAAPGSSLN